ncbi:MAG: trigger factor [Bacteroidales bacterium]|nr:trigger factor [Bacteroidales bacterium]MDD4216589.1 trigger factor [Bacteroidales bacterium]MDY0140786.1 trigger factor [Bacteroidales bacterium]
MEVVKNQIDELNANLIVSVAKEDIAENVEKTIKDYKRKANVAGFRLGHVPIGLIKKMYGNEIIAEELNKVVSQSLSEFLVKEELNILGEPLPSEKQQQVDFGTQEQFEFIFDIGLSPEFEIKLTKHDKINKYVIKVDDDMINKYVESYQQRFGSFKETEKSDENSMLKVNLVQIDENAEEIEDGVKVEDVSISIKMIKDEEIKKQFVGITKDTYIDFDLKKAYPNDAEISSLLKIEKDQVEGLLSLFRAQVLVVKEFSKAELNQDFYNQCFGDNAVNNEEEFKERIVEDIRASFQRETKYKMTIDIREKFTKKLDLKLPEEFLKRWVIATNKDITDEQLESEFPRFIEDLQWTLIKSKIAKENDLKVDEEEMKNAAKQQLLAQFSQYGMSYVPDEYLDKYAVEMLSKREEANKLYEQEIEEKIVDFVVEAIKIEEKEVTIDGFNELFK